MGNFISSTTVRVLFVIGFMLLYMGEIFFLFFLHRRTYMSVRALFDPFLIGSGAFLNVKGGGMFFKYFDSL